MKQTGSNENAKLNNEWAKHVRKRGKKITSKIRREKDRKIIATEYELQPYEFQCEGCNKIHTQSSYCIAQTTIGHTITFTCDCGHETILNKEDLP